MDALLKINREDGITVLCNLHTLDTAKTYCERIIGMKQGTFVFDGSPSDLALDLLRDIYGVGEGEDDEEEDEEEDEEGEDDEEEDEEEEIKKIKIGSFTLPLLFPQPKPGK